ncbi:hypothetical protein [Flavivirga spongiicola]|uniref:Uncharacterized protein n=1 Tax=Flavivirga spongiicola TaxID=421621 RepID=A0ABU7XV55_9FLAO|nr:hypothetical protein [Flavivirga sp. MEBiC05379]MDO5979398.1 hypothetical protein [Flavivirga sp. MEBiC05379]
MGFLTKEKYLRVLCFVIGVIFLGFMIRKTMTSQKNIKQVSLNDVLVENFMGVIKEKIIEIDNHHRAYVLFKNEKKINLTNELYEDLEVGDSIIKRKNDLFVIVFRNDIIYKLDYFTGDAIDSE